LTGRSNPARPLEVEWVPIHTLRPNPRNARTHSNKQRRQIAASFWQFGFLNPVLADDAGLILAGQGRVEAAKLEGFTTVPIIRFDHLTDAQKRAYVIADNKVAEQAGWDREILSIELGELIDLLPAEEFDVSLTGFEAPEIDLLLAGMAPPARRAPEDDTPALPRIPISRRGDFVAAGKAQDIVRRCARAGGLGSLDERSFRVGGVLRSAL
jgi:ParB-like chromosome segregation protein Spo0J